MRTYRVDSIKNYLSPSEAHWTRVKSQAIAMIPTPLQMQPTEYIRNSWASKTYGQTAQIEVASVHDGEMWALRVTCPGSGSEKADFPDAFAVALPVRNNPVLALMGAKDAPIHYLRWAANKEGVMSLLATGIGQSQPGPKLNFAVQAASDSKLWRIVIARALGVGKDIAPLTPGRKTGIGFALWQGGNDERAGIKAFSIDWTELAVDA